MLKTLASSGEIAVLLVEQNIGVAIEVADTIDVMVNGRVARSMPAAELASNPELQQRLLGVKVVDEEEAPEEVPLPSGPQPTRVFTVKREVDAPAALQPEQEPVARNERAVRSFTRWNASDPGQPASDRPVDAPQPGSAEPETREARVFEFPVAATSGRAAYVAGTFDTKGRELFFVRSCLEKLGLRTVTVDLSTSGRPSPATVHPREVARCHP